MTGDAILRVEALTVRFGGLTAVDRVSFEVPRGRITSVIGPNGAGKSTLFNLVSGALKPAEGRVMLDGVYVTGWPSNRLNSAGIARSFQITNLFSELSVEENIRLAAQVHERWTTGFQPVSRSRRADAIVEEVIERFELAPKRDRDVSALSHGEQRRLEIAVALASRPKLLLLDEPTQGMSHGDTAATADLIRRLAGDVTIMVVEHDVGLVMDISDQIVVMALGAKIAQGLPAEVRADPAVREAYLGHA